MAQVLYRKYRSKKLTEIVGQEHITKTLSEALGSGRISHAYLFTGPRGVGKTSVARILAHEVNNLPYEDDKPHIDIIEIDAASNRRIDEIRDLREKVHTMPTSAKYKVYIIDEVHMLTKEAFNALLKTLEEPPAHVIFILATTDPHKLPDTIISRTQRFNFRPIIKSNAVDHLSSIAKNEKIKITLPALELIAEHGEGSFRDSISLLDQLGHGSKEITEEDVRKVLGIPPSQAIDQLIDFIDSGVASYKEVADELNQLLDQGYGPSLLAKRLAGDIRRRLIEDSLNTPSSTAIKLLKELLNVDASTDPASYLLLAILSAIPRDTTKAKTTKTEPSKEAPPKVKAENTTSKQPIAVKEVTESIWPEVLSELKSRQNTLYAIVRMAQPQFKDKRVELIFDFAFHQKQVSEAKNKQIISDIISELTGQDYQIVCSLSEVPVKKSQDLENVAKIFGGGELVD